MFTFVRSDHVQFTLIGSFSKDDPNIIRVASTSYLCTISLGWIWKERYQHYIMYHVTCTTSSALIRWLFYYRANNDKYHLNSRATIKQKQILGLGLKHMHKLWVTQAVVTTHTHTHTHTHKSWVKATVGGPTGTVWMSPTRLMEALPHTHTHTLQQNTRQITSKATTGGLQPLLHYLETRRWSIIKLLHRFPSQSCNSSR